MWFLQILAGIFFILFGLAAWLQKRLRDAVAERHPGALQVIDSVTRSLPRGARALDRRTRYQMLRDPEIDRHIHDLDRVQILVQYALLAFSVVILLFVIFSAARA